MDNIIVAAHIRGIWVFVSTIAGAIVTVIVAANASGIWVFVFAIVGAIAIAIAAVFIFRIKNKTQSSFPKSTAKKEGEVSQNDPVKNSLLKNIECYQDHKCYEYKVEAELTNHPKDKNFFCCTVNYELKKNIFKNNSGVLKFRIKRIWQGNHYKDEEDSRDRFSYEHYVDIDEEKIHNSLAGWESDEMYMIRDLYIKSSKKYKKWTEIPIEKKHKASALNEKYFDFEARVEADEEIKQLRYTEQYVLEKNSFFYFPVDIPTELFKMKFDCTDVRDQLADIKCLDFLSTSGKPVRIMDSANDNVFAFEKESNEWIIPNSSFVFIWYEKNKRN